VSVYEETTAVDIPDRREQDLLHVSLTDMVYLITVLVIALTVGFILGKGVFGLVVLVAGAGWVQIGYGRVYFVLFVIKPSSFRIDYLQKGNVWESNPKHPLLARYLRAPPSTRHLAINGVGDLAVVYNTRNKTDTIIVAGKGSDIAAMGLPVQREIHDRVTEVVKRLASGRDLQVTISLLYSRRPQNVLEVLDQYDATMHPDFVPPDPDLEIHGLTAEEIDLSGMDERRAKAAIDLCNDQEQLTQLLRKEEAGLNRDGVKQYIEECLDELVCSANVATITNELLEFARTDSAIPTMAVAITIRRDTILHKLAVKGESLADEESEDPLVIQIAQAAVDGLANCGVEQPYAYNLEDMHAHLRLGWDVTQDAAYAEWLASADGNYSDPRWEHFHGPQECIRILKRRRKRAVCQTDGSYHAILMATGFPPEAEPHTLRPLFAIDVPHVAVTVTGPVFGSGREVLALDMANPTTDVFRESLGMVYETQRALDRYERRQSRLESVYRARYAYRFNVVFVVSSTSPVQLERDVEEAIRSIQAVDNMRIKRINESYLLYPWLTVGTTGVPN